MQNKGGRPAKRTKKALVKQPNVPVVFCNDLTGFTEEVMKLRNLPNRESLLLKFGVDEGQSFLKVTLSVIHVLAHTDTEKKTFRSRLKDSGVKKIFIVAATPGKETHENLVTILKSLDMPSFTFPFEIAADLKAVAMMTGLSSSSAATYPCPLCLWPKRDGATGGAQPMRTFESNIDDYKRWMGPEGKGNKDLNKKFNNINNLPLLIYVDPSAHIVDIFAFPCVHMHTGIFNHMFFALEKIIPEIVVWAQLLHLKRQEYHGKVYEVMRYAV